MAHKESYLNQRNTLLAGAAALAGLIGTLSSIFLPRRSVQKGWMDKARNVAGKMRDNVHGFYPHHDHEMLNKNLMIGGVAGGIVGITTALLLAPKAGNELIQDIVDQFQGNHQGGGRKKSRSTSAKRTVRKAARRAGEAVTKVKRKAAAKKAAATRSAKKRSSSSRGKKKKGGSHSHSHGQSEHKKETEQAAS